MVAPVDEDARGIVAPPVGLAHFRLDRRAPAPGLARFVDRYWIARWDLTDRPPHTQRVLAHPVVNVVLTEGAATVTGPTTRMTGRTLAGAGWALGIMFRPAGFRPFLGRPVRLITDATVPAAAVFGGRLATLAEAMDDLGADALVAAVEDVLAARTPPAGAGPEPGEATTALVERVAADPGLVRVESLAAEAGLSRRQLQRRFADHVGLTPKAVIRRYRLFEAAERARRREPVDWARLAAELGYSDQPHLVRDFRAAFGLPPEQYARMCAAATGPGPGPTLEAAATLR